MSTPNTMTEGRFAAELFLQSLADHGEVMTHEEAGGAFAETVCDEIIKARRGGTQDDQMQLLSFLARIGEALYWQSEKEREERNAFTFDGAELRRLIAHAHEVADKALGDFENHMLLVDTVAAVVKDMRAAARLIGMEGGGSTSETAAGRQVSAVISLSLAGAAKKKGGAT